MMTKQTFKAVLFDLDGTLLDTAPDLIAALGVLTEKPLPITKELRAASGKGFRGLLKTGLNVDDQHADYPQYFEKFQAHYDKCLLESTSYFTGMKELLQRLDEIAIPWGIVTNKPEKFTRQIVAGLQLTGRAKCVISGDSLTSRKPHPEPILQACDLLQKSPAECIYVGDSESDVIASKAAGTTSLVALYGYISEKEDPRAWDADGYVTEPLQILQWL
jgi:N-acetyl-D-muramate 6-phosphate phosphatase